MRKDKDKMHKAHLEILRDITIDDLPGIKIDSLLFTDIIFSYEMKWSYVIKHLLVRLFSRYLRLNYISQPNSDILLFTYIYNRKDHDGYWAKFKKVVNNYNEVSFHYSYSFKNLKFSIKDIESYIYIIRKFKNIKELKTKVWISLQILNAIKIVNKLNENNIKSKVLFTFFDGGYEGNIITQYFKNAKYKTITLQHGQCLYRGDNIDRLNQSVILNFISDYCICKGEFAKQQFIKANFPKEMLLPLGNLDCDNYTSKIEEESPTKNTFCVFLDTPSYPFYSFSTKTLINTANRFAEKYSFKYYVKPHPADTKKEYLKYIEGDFCIGELDKNYSIMSIKHKVDFSIFHASAIYSDLLLNHMKSFKLETKISFEIVLNPDDTFSSVDELMRKLESWRLFSLIDKEKHFITENIHYSNPSGVINRYKDFISQISQL